MKSLGKQNVICSSYSDGKHTGTWSEKRVVYEKADGTYWINDLSSKRKVMRTSSGDFDCVYHTKTVHSVDIEELFNKLGFQFKKG